jgi:PilZ domain
LANDQDKMFEIMQDLPEPVGNRRRVPRRPIHRQVGVLYKGVYRLCWAFEIGEGGILIDSEVRMKEGDRLVVTVRIPGVLQGVMMSKVVYELKPNKAGELVKYGLQFDKIEFDIRRKMRNYVASSTK